MTNAFSTLTLTLDIGDLKLALQYWEKRASKCLDKYKKYRARGATNNASFYETKAGMCRLKAEKVRAQLTQEEESSGEVCLANLRFVYDHNGLSHMCDMNERFDPLN